ncbi:hypothetical protein [Sphingopyxis sp. MWB1]|uniref:hypothetical protein n=1 Tax=Sphingopyxis sp. MWB1 TaxID=1537715 RepID=UPI00051A5E09|nr:hypothetical protein [Sphingopyxis sp. MWB1]
MTGDKKIVGLWRDTGAEESADTQLAQAAEGNAPRSADRAITGEGEAEKAQTQPDWLDMSALTEQEQDESRPPPSSTRDRLMGGLLLLLAAGWTLFIAWAGSNDFTQVPPMGDLPTIIATWSMPVALLLLGWMAFLRSGRAEQGRFARVAAALRQENRALSESLAQLNRDLSTAQQGLSEQARLVQQLGVDTVQRLNESSDRLASNASVIANAHDQLARSGDVALQRMDGLLAGLPRIDDVAQRLAVNFREAGLVAHQQGANLEAHLAALAEEGAKAAQLGEASAAKLHEAIGALTQQAKETEADLLGASDHITHAHETALARMHEGSAAIDTQMSTLLATITDRMEQSWQAFRRHVGEAADHMDERLRDARSAGEAMGEVLSGHGEASEALAQRFFGHVDTLSHQLQNVETAVTATNANIARALEGTREQLTAFQAEVGKGNGASQQLVGHAESLLLALDAVTRELDETLPRALDRIGAHKQETEDALATLKPMLEASELVAQSTLSHVNAAQSLLKKNQAKLAVQAESQEAMAQGLQASLAEAEASFAKLRENADAFSRADGEKMMAALGSVRDTADTIAADTRARFDAIAADIGAAMQGAAAQALDTLFEGEAKRQIAAIEDASQRAIRAADDAAGRLKQQLASLIDGSSALQTRVAEAEQAITASDRDTLAKQVGILTEALKSTAIDVTKILSSEVSDTAWDAYLKGDRGVFSRRAVKLVENSEAKEILRLYQEEGAFHSAVNQYIHDFEAMLRLLLGARDGSAISVTLLSSDIGKLYVALAQAIDRLRG